MQRDKIKPILFSIIKHSSKEERFRPNIDDAIAYARTQLEQEEKAA